MANNNNTVNWDSYFPKDSENNISFFDESTEEETEEEKEERLRKEEEERLRLLEEETLLAEETEDVFSEKGTALSKEEIFNLVNEKEDVDLENIFENYNFVDPVEEEISSVDATADASNIENTPYMIKRKLDYGATQEPMILGSLFRLSSAKVRSLLTDRTYSEAARDIEQERQDVIRKEFPLLYGKNEDALIIAGRVGTALADPVTFFIPWTKVAKAGKIATLGVGAGVSSADIALREASLYGEVSGTSVALAAGLGGTSTLLSQMFISGKVVRDSFETIGENGVKIRKVIDLGDGLKVQNPLLVIRDKQKLAREYKKYAETGEEILGQHGKIMQKLIDTTKNVGFHETRKELISLDIKNLKDDLLKLKEKDFGLNNKIDFMGNPIESANTKRTKVLLKEAQKELKANEVKLQKLYTEQMPRDWADSAYIQLTTALKNGVFEQEGMARFVGQELTTPLFGTLGGLSIGLVLSEENSTAKDMYWWMAAGAFNGWFLKKLNRTKFSIQEQKIVDEVLEEADKVYKEATMSVLKRHFAGTESTLLQGGIGAARRAGAKLFNVQGGGLKQDVVLSESVESAKTRAINLWGSVRLGKLIQNQSEPTVFAAGRILNQKNMSSSSKHSFLQEGDLENWSAVKLADDIEQFTNEFKKYAESAGLQLTEETQYGLTQLLKKDLKTNQGTAIKEIAEAFKIQFVNDFNNNRIQLMTQGDFKGKYINIADLNTKNIRYYSKYEVRDILNKESSEQVRRASGELEDSWATQQARRYIDGQLETRKHSIWARVDDAGDESLSGKSLFRNRAGEDEDVILTAARHFDNRRVLYDQEARAYLANKEYFVDDPILTLQSLINNTIPVVEFARVFGAKGQGLQKVFQEIKDEVAQLSGGSISNNSLREITNKQIKLVKQGVEGYFGLHQVEYALKNETHLTILMALQTLLTTTKLTKVSIPSLGDIIQTWKNGGMGAAREALVRTIKSKNKEDVWQSSDALGTKLKRPKGKLTADDTSLSDVVWNNRLYNGLLDRELKNFFIEINPNNVNQVRLQNLQQKYFEGIQLGRITRFSRTYAYDAGAIRAFQLSKLIKADGTLPKRFKNEAARLDLDVDSLQYLKKFKDMNAIEGDTLGEELISRAGFKSAERDALIPTVGNRRLFSQSRNPYVRFLGSFLSWAQAKSAQTNALISRVEGGDAALLIRMAAALPVFMAVRELQLDLNSSEEFKEGALVSKSPEISDNLKRIGDGLMFSAEVIPWYVDKFVNTFFRGYNDDDLVTSLAPVVKLIEDLAKEMFVEVPKGLEEGTTNKRWSGPIGFGESAIPFFKDLNRGTGFINPALEIDIIGKPKDMSLEDWLNGEEYGPLYEEFNPPPLTQDSYPSLTRKGIFKGGALSKDHPVPKAPVIPMERKDRMGDQSYATQASAEPINPFTGEPYTAIYKR